MSIREKLQHAAPRVVREAIRSKKFSGDTAGLAGGFLQGNLAILPASLATDFLRFCQRNPKPCPLVGVSETGDPFLPTLGEDIDIRTDVPQYKVFREGEFVLQVSDIGDIWQDDFVTFVLGCSFSFEKALLQNGIPVRHIENNSTVPMYRTSIPTVSAGPFTGEYVVSMRPLSVSNTIRAIEITQQFPKAHGAPVHFGDPQVIGISDINKPDFGDPVSIANDEIPVFWACGVTPQIALQHARPAISITHAPGHMLITDLKGHLISRETILQLLFSPRKHIH